MNFVKQIPDPPEIGACELHGNFEFRYLLLAINTWFPINARSVQKSAKKKTCRGRRKKEFDRVERLNRLKLSCGFSLRNLNASFDDFISESPEQSKAKSTAEKYAKHVIDGGAGCLVMVGSVGAGKTLLATAIADAFINSGKKCCIVRVSEMLRDFKDSWRKDSEKSESQVMGYYSNVGLLIIDEIGIQFGSDTEKNYIFEVIDNRYQDMKPTVFISNLDVEGVKESIGARVYDRLREDGGKVIAFDWESMRGRKP